jgi:hypothetical protein
MLFGIKLPNHEYPIIVEGKHSPLPIVKKYRREVQEAELEHTKAISSYLVRHPFKYNLNGKKIEDLNNEELEDYLACYNNHIARAEHFTRSFPREVTPLTVRLKTHGYKILRIKYLW